MKMKALDLFCGVGGATKGLQDLGYHVTGVDIEEQPFYIGDDFIRMNAFDYEMLNMYDLIWASPPCQRWVTQAKGERPDYITPIRKKLRASGVPYVIENVVRAPLIKPVILCGSMFGLRVRRHRGFETSFQVINTMTCQHKGQEIFAYYGNQGREAFRAKPWQQRYFAWKCRTGKA